jgi:hypothetical protein
VERSEKFRADIVELDGGVVWRGVMEPGWRRTVHYGQDESLCEDPHVFYHVSGRFHFLMRDGTELEGNPGDITVLPPGHDAWVIGDDTVVVIDFFDASNYRLAGGHAPSD